MGAEPERLRLLKVQSRKGSSLGDRVFDSLTLDMRLAGLVEAWASGATWEQVMKASGASFTAAAAAPAAPTAVALAMRQQDSTLDDGDVARLLGRTADVLRQLIHVEDLPQEVRQTARQAVKAMNRAPISELLKG